MSKKLYPETDIQNIANAIRTLNGSSDTYTVSEMASAVALPENGYYLKESTEANPLSITDGEELNAQSCEVTFEPIQDLNGYDSPWIDSDVINKEPYLMRAVGGTATRIGNSLYDTLVGGTVAFNQLVNKSKFNASGSGTNYSYVSNNDGSFTITVSDTISTDTIVLLTANTSTSYIKLPNQHIFFYDLNTTSDKIYLRDSFNGYTYATKGVRQKSGNNTSFLLSITLKSGLTAGVYTIKPQITDLIQALGSTIADYIYSLEQATKGSGVAYFRSLFPKDYYSYNAGQLMSVKALSHKMVGFNQWDEVWEVGGINGTTGQNDDNVNNRIRSKNYIPILPNTVYYFRATTGSTFNIYEYDSNKNFIQVYGRNANTTFTPSIGTAYIRFLQYTPNTTTYNHDICINFHWDGERDGEYKAYEEHIYPLDSDLELRGIPKLDANNNLYYDGDTYESDGTVTRKYGIVDLGSLSWDKIEAGSGKHRFSTSIALMKPSTLNKICSNYPSSKSTYGGIFGVQSSNYNIYIFDSDYENATFTEFKTAMSGVYLVYELETPTTETADTFQNPQLVDNWGTEEYTDSRTIQIPVGHETYQANICPISGWDSLVLNVSGINQLNNSLFVNDKWLENNGTISNYEGRKSTTSFLPIGIIKTFWFGAFLDGVIREGDYAIKIVTYSSDTESSFIRVVSSGINGHTFSFFDNEKYFRIGTTRNDFDVAMNYPTTANTYEPYQGSTHTATFPEIEYGGSYDFVSGKGLIKYNIVNMGRLYWSFNNDTQTFVALVTAMKSDITSQGRLNVMCSNYKTADSIPPTWGTLPDKTILKYYDMNLICVKDTDYSTDAAAFKTAMSGVQLCYDLATPQEITLTPETIELLKGNNVLWSDSNGNVKLKYFSKSLS